MRLRCLALIIISKAVIITAAAQNSVSSSAIKNFHRIVALIQDDSVKTLATLVDYPLARQNPLPDIKSPQQFIKYYPVLIDASFKQKLLSFKDSDIFYSEGNYAIGNGEMWMDGSGKISAINYSSAKEQKLKQEITQRTQQKMYPGINNWISNVKVLKSDKFLIRIDKTAKGLRYVSWHKGENMSDKPDLILYNGIAEAEGTQGGWTWTFKNGKWEYIVEDNKMCENVKDCGYFLVVSLNGKEVFKDRCYAEK